MCNAQLLRNTTEFSADLPRHTASFRGRATTSPPRIPWLPRTAQWHPGDVNGPEIHLEVDPELRLFVAHERRNGRTAVITDGASTLGHVVESLGVPLTEAGQLLVDGRPVPVSHIPGAGELVEVRAVARPQRIEGAPLRFLLDVHLGTLARRLRLLGVDAAYESADIGDPALAALSAKEQRVLLSRDRGLLRRREIWAGAYIYSDRPDDQLRDVLERFAPALAPWTPVHRMQRAAHRGRQGLRQRAAGARHAAVVRRLRAVRGVRPGVLARRPPRTPGEDRRQCGPRVR